MRDGSASHSAERFRQYYEAEHSDWGNTSGPGSDSFHTIEYRSFVSKFVRLNNILRITDVGCGDWQFSRFIDFGSSDYIGYDVVDSVIKTNNERYASRIMFSMMPDNLGDIRGGDLLLMKDVLQHLSDTDIYKFRDEVFPKFKFCLITNSFNKLDTPQNVDIESGSFRCLDLTAKPYQINGCYVLDFGSAVWERIRVLLISI